MPQKLVENLYQAVYLQTMNFYLLFRFGCLRFFNKKCLLRSREILQSFARSTKANLASVLMHSLQENGGIMIGF
ncbi:hypothetical protein C3F00_043920, partial [Pseudomonas sp. MWU13-2860]